MRQSGMGRELGLAGIKEYLGQFLQTFLGGMGSLPLHAPRCR